MLRKSIIFTAGAALIVGAPAFAQTPGGDGAGGIFAKSPKNTGKGKDKAEAKDEAANADAAADAAADVKAAPADNSAAVTADTDAAASANAQAAENSQGVMNANTRAVGQANANSALAAGAVAASALPGLTTGLNVKTSAGASLGTVSQVVTGADGSIRLVIVAGADGKTYRLLPNQLSIDGGVVTTTQIGAGG